MKKGSKGLFFAAVAGAALALRWRSAARERQRFDYQGKAVVICGASRGLGLELARQLTYKGARLALLARSLEDLEDAERELRAYDAEVMALPCDVRDPDQVEYALGRVIRRYGQIDVLINNAGIIQVGPLEHMQVEDYQDAMNTHFWGPFYTIQTAVNAMRKSGGGRIVNIASIGGEVAVPHLLPYSASKHALVGFSDGLRAELAKDGILVTTVSPGLMRTGSYVNALFKGRHRQEYAWFSIFAAHPLSSTSVQRAAKQILEACRRGQPKLIITVQARLLTLLSALAPNLTAAAMKLFNRSLPGPEPRWGDAARTGWKSQSNLSPSGLTIQGDRAVAENNQLRGHAPIPLPSADKAKPEPSFREYAITRRHL